MSELSRRTFTANALATLVASTVPTIGRGQTAAQPGKILVGYPAGGTLDQTARRISDVWRQQGRIYVVDNRAGAAGRIANAQLKRERADGSAVLCTHTSAMTIYPHVYPKLAYDPAADFTPVTPVAAAVCAFAVSSVVPASVKTLSDYAKWVKDSPKHASYASPAAGSMAHFLGFRFGQAAGFSLQHIAYRGSAPALQDLLGGQIATYLGFVGDFLPYLKTAKVRILATTGEQRSRFMREVPTFIEQGFPTVTGAESYGLFLPPQTPPASVAAIYDAARLAVGDSALKAGFDQLGMEPTTLTPREYAAKIAEERDVWRPIVQACGFTSEE